MCEMRWLLFFNWLILCITFIDFYMLGHLYLPGVSTILFSWIIFLTCCWIQLANILLMIFVYMFRDIDLYFFLCFLFLVLKMIWSHNCLGNSSPPTLWAIWEELKLITLEKLGRMKQWRHFLLSVPLLVLLLVSRSLP